LWLDEAVIFNISQGSFLEIILENAKRNSAPPSYPLLVHLIAGSGQSEAALRSLSALAGIASIPVMYWLARQFLSRWASLFAALVVAISVQQVVYAQQLREYSLAFLLSALTIGFFVRFFRNPAGWNWLFFGLASSAGIALQYGLGLLALALALVFVIEWFLVSQVRTRQMMIKFCLAQALALATAIGVFLSSLRGQMRLGFGSTSASNYLFAAYGDGSLASLYTLVTKNTSELLGFAFLPGLFVFLFLVGLWLLFVKKVHLMLALTLIPGAITILAAWLRYYPYHGGRQDIFLTPMIYLVAAQGMDYLLEIDRRRIIPGLITIVLLWTGVNAVLIYQKFPGIEDLRPIASTITKQAQPGDRVYIYFGARDAANYYLKGLDLPRVEGIYSRDEPQGYLPQIDEIMAEPGRLWLVFSHCFGGECDLIRDHVARQRLVEPMHSGNDAYLYLVH
jgi:4-amino-4-deoxy-L-arabinose transferase-like glycosyltransferase